MRGRPGPRRVPGRRAARAAAWVACAAGTAALATACSGPGQPASGASPVSQATVSATPGSPAASTAPATPSQAPAPTRPVPAFCHEGGPRLWAHLARCGWPGPGNTGPDLSQCPGGRLVPNSGPLTRVIRVTAPGTVIACQDIQGMLDIEAQNVTIKNSVIESNSGKTGEAANGTGDIKIEDGASAVVDQVKINGDDGVHACVWDQGTREIVNAVDCYGVDDGVWSWADSSYSKTTGDHFVVENSYFHDFTTRTSNGHEDGYQTEGASDGLIQHNTYRMTIGADSAVAIWDSLRASHNIKVDGNLITGGGFAIYAEDYNPGDGGPGDPAAAGGFSVTDIRFVKNVFSTEAAGCVGQFGVWFDRPGWTYNGGPTDGWRRHGNTVLETGQNVDNENPSGNGSSCG